MNVIAFGKGRGDTLDGRVVLVVRVARHLPAPLLVSLHWKDVRDKLTTMVFLNGPQYAGEYGSAVSMSANFNARKRHRARAQRCADPNESWETAALYPEAEMPHAEEQTV